MFFSAKTVSFHKSVAQLPFSFFRILAQPRLIVCHTAQLARSILQLTDSTCQYCLVLTQDEELEQLRLEKSGDVCQIIDLDEFKVSFTADSSVLYSLCMCMFVFP